MIPRLGQHRIAGCGFQELQTPRSPSYTYSIAPFHRLADVVGTASKPCLQLFSLSTNPRGGIEVVVVGKFAFLVTHPIEYSIRRPVYSKVHGAPVWFSFESVASMRRRSLLNTLQTTNHGNICDHRYSRIGKDKTKYDFELKLKDHGRCQALSARR